MTTSPPEPPKSAGELQRKPRLAFDQKLERGPQVLLLDVQLLEPTHLLRAVAFSISLLGEPHEVRGVFGESLVQLACLTEALPCVLAERLQHPIAHLGGALRLGDQQRLHDQLSQ